MLTILQGGNASRAYEQIVQAMYLNTQHNLHTLAPAASLFHGASLDRIGGHTPKQSMACTSLMNFTS
jgi:anaphase-promoting complex subunit 5